MKKIFSLILAFLTLFSLTSCANEPKEVVPIIPAESFSRGSGTEADPYIISTPEELFYLQVAINEQSNVDYLNDHFRLEKDIDLGGNAWRPIGLKADGETWPFNGTFDGAGKKILNFTCSMPEEEATFHHLGLFCALGGTVKNLTVDRCTVIGTERSYAGAIAATLQEGGLLVNCSVGRKSTVTGDLAGGLVGTCWTANFENCSNAASVTGLRIAGGIVGSWEIPDRMGIHQEGVALHMDNCSSSGSITSGRFVGGVIGYLGFAMPGEVTMNNCSNAGEIRLDRSLDSDQNTNPPAVGGLVGIIRGTNPEQKIALLACSNAGSVDAGGAADSDAGGLLGRGSCIGSLSLLSCSNAGTVHGSMHAGGLAGRWSIHENDITRIPDAHTMLLNVSACSNAGEVSAAVAGGLVGSLCATGNALEATFENSVNSAHVTVGFTGGGLIGGMGTGIPTRLAHCTCDGNVIAQEDVQASSLTGYLCGLIGLVREVKPELEGCSFTGNLDSRDDERYRTSETYIFDP